MILSDNETKVDLLNSEATAKSIARLISERPGHPITIGVHGDWGAGKSSVLEMIESELLDKGEDIIVIKFNGWRFQGFEDAKISLIEGIVTELIEKRSLWTVAKDEVQQIFKRIDWLKLAKKAGGLALSVATGIPTPDSINMLIGSLKTMAGTAGGDIKKEDVEKIIEEAGGLLKPSSEKNVPDEIRAFRKDFDILLKKSNIKQLIVLVDDLDRCLPETAIETLEAIRLFVFTTQTAFVIAADEAMIEYAVKRHFPEFETTNGSQTYSRNYLEKLIQVPFRIPVLGETETRIYVTLLLIGSKVGEDDSGFNKLIKDARERLRKPWESIPLDHTAITKAMGNNPEAQAALTLSDQIGPVLANGTTGNPRQIKRFLNTLLLRERAAEERGFKELVSLPILAKLMIAERFLPSSFFDIIASSAARDSNGICQDLVQLESNLAIAQSEKTNSSDKKKLNGQKSTDALIVEWESHKDIQEWAQMIPALTSVDLRPYIFISKGKKDYFSLNANLGILTSLTDKLYTSSKLSVAVMHTEISKLSLDQARMVFSAIRDKIVISDDLSKRPIGIPGLTALVKNHDSLQSDLIALLQGLPVPKLGAWVLSGWDAVFTKSQEKKKFSDLINSWANSSNANLATVAKAVTRFKK
ncbi:MAG: p-loop protein [Daejeonella sp.]|nr:p-loop protein [Daejeonella sp.]